MRTSTLRLATQYSVPDVDSATLAFFRVHWARCRCLSRSDLFTCAASTLCDKACSPEKLAVSLLRALGSDDAMGGLRLFEPGATDVSFDERWLLAALAAAARRDTDSLTFLLGRRLPKTARRQICALIMALSRRFPAESQK